VVLRQEQGESPLLVEYLRRFPLWADQLKPLFEVHQALESGELFATCEAGPGTSAAAPAGATVADLPVIPGFEVLRELGRGGMGVVYWAWQGRLNRTVALKMILAGDHASPRERARFGIEAEAIGRLQHANIVPIYELGEHAGRPYLAMEYVDGGSLAQKLSSTPLPA
jgi:serine/threonine protein kinase